MSPQIIQQLLKKYNFTPTKIRGQNFLIDESVLDEITVAGQIQKTDCVVEIGPGFGFLTKKLAAMAGKVLALEIDRRAVEVLAEELREVRNVEKVSGDCLDFDFLKFHCEPGQYRLIANIPYQITNKIFEKFLLGEYPPRRAVLLMQREVGERILARDGVLNALAVLLQNAYEVREVCRVSREKFFPVPKVDSSVLAFDFRQTLPAGFSGFVHQGFSHPKKKAINNLTTLFSAISLQKNFSQLGIDLDVRPGKINFEQWFELYRSLKK